MFTNLRKHSMDWSKKLEHGIAKMIVTWLIMDVVRSRIEPTLYTKVNEHEHILIVCLYVDDMIFIGDLELDEFKETTMK